MSAGGGIPGLGNANLSFERGPAVMGGMEAEERVYDPLWANARALLDYLTEREMIVRELSQARIGQVVLVTGSLVILDLQLLKGAWESKEVKKLINGGAITPHEGNRHQRRAARADNVPAAPSGQVEQVIDILKLLPHVMQARMRSGTSIAWCNLREESLVPSAGDLTLKHGVAIAGDWHLLGIVDALPDNFNVNTQSALEAVGLDPALAHLPAVALANIVLALSGITRTMLGRPDNAFGVTPILIFRTVLDTQIGI